MFKKIISKLYKKYCSPDLVAMTKIQMLGVSHEERNPDDLQEDEREYIKGLAHDVLNNEAFLLAINNTKRRIMLHIQNEALDANTIFFDRFKISGIDLVRLELESYANMDEISDDLDDLDNL